MRLFLTSLLTLFVFSSTADADIFLRKDGGKSADSGSKSIFLNPNSSNNRKVPSYNIIQGGQKATKKDLDYSSSARRLQSQKLREARQREYKRRRDDSINLQTLRADIAKKGIRSIDQLRDRSAYEAMINARSNDLNQITYASQQQGAISNAEKYSAKLETLKQQVTAQASANAQNYSDNAARRGDPRTDDINRANRGTRNPILLNP